MWQGEIHKLARHSSEGGNPDDLNKMHLCLAGLLHFVRNDGILNSRHCNKASAASVARQRRSRRSDPERLVIARRRSRRGNPERLVIARRRSRRGNPERLVIARRRSRRGNPGALNKMHLYPAGLLHFVRNDGKGVMNCGSINSCMDRIQGSAD
jgi:hypothetical protein